MSHSEIQAKQDKHAAEAAIPMLDLRAQFATIADEVRSALDEVLASQSFVLGPQVAGLERELAHYSERRFGVGVASGTDALILSLRACGVGPGDEVIVPAFTFVATAGAVSALGAQPVFADCDARTLTIDPRSVEAVVTSRTSAVIAVHLFGAAADLNALGEVSTQHGLALIEDNAQGLGGTYRGRKLGSIGIVGATSFYPTKNLGGCGDGGMVLTDSEEIAERLAILRNHGQAGGQTGRYVSTEAGWNSRLDELQAAVLRVKLRRLDGWLAARGALAARYNARFEKLDGICPVEAPAECRHAYHLYTVRVPGDGPSNPAARRDHVRRRLAQQEITTGVYYPVPLHLQPLYASLGGKLGDLPVAERAAQEVLSLPLYPEMSVEQLDRVADAVADALRR